MCPRSISLQAYSGRKHTTDRQPCGSPVPLQDLSSTEPSVSPTSEEGPEGPICLVFYR